MRPKRQGECLLLLVAASLAITAVTAPRAMAHFGGTGLDVVNIKIEPYSYSPTWQVPMDRALANWNATPTDVNIAKSASALGYVNVASYSDTWYGNYRSDGGASPYIRLNSRTISRDASNFSNFVTSVLVHEFGHAFNLGHNTLSTTSIMCDTRNRNVMTTPQTHDVNDVNSYYRHSLLGASSKAAA